MKNKLDFVAEHESGYFFYNTMKVLDFVGINFRGFVKNYKFVDS